MEILTNLLQTIPTLLMANFGTIIGLSIILGAIAVLNKIKKDIASKIVEMLKDGVTIKHSSTMKMSIACDTEINVELSKLQFATDSSRAGLFLFHNGSVFSTNNPIWKISATHERCVAGITQEFHNVQDVKSSLLTPLISPLFSGDDIHGVKKIILEDGNREDAYRIDPDEIHNNYVQGFLKGRGSKFAIMSPVKDWNGSVIGFILVEYCSEGYLTERDLISNANLACEATKKIYGLIANLESK